MRTQSALVVPLLPGLGSPLAPAHVDLVLCTECGLVRWYADAEARANAKRNKHWAPIRSPETES